jgi:hypothetical protein
MSDTSLNQTGDPEPPGETIKPPTVSESSTSQSDVGIKPPTVSNTSDDSSTDDSANDPPIIITGGGGQT